MLAFDTVLDPNARRFIEMVDQLGIRGWRTRYSFYPNDKYKALIQTDRSRGMQIYWKEILARAHLASATAILRSTQWIEGMRVATTAGNLLSFAACFRGLIESAADSSSALKLVALSLARDHGYVVQALTGQLKSQTFLAPELEETLIHYAYARHLTKAELLAAPLTHKALKVRDYIDLLVQGKVTDVAPCYQALCDLTHPGATSVWMWLRPDNDHAMHIQADQDNAIIRDFLAEWTTTFSELLMFAFNPALATLRVLNYFPLTSWHTPALDKWEMSGIPLWKKCGEQLKGVRPRTQGRLSIVKPTPRNVTPRKQRG
ncbi:hypothetical protein YTPLAS18_28210 [Nitrospira sp.]|nr:hypothetical protein YTPLAS18_28210 [Nitrospira sp.]